mmetsp:Transcript_12617/g.20211  ORF Transcript_12617/g.20211 Transcript_12617/m.20211 type:complete len:296 (-) Transcript_12617:917-1804(-)
MDSTHCYPCKFKEVGCASTLPRDLMAKHLDRDAKSHLRLVVGALNKEKDENELLKEAMTCAQTRCRKVEAENALLRGKADMIKSRIEAMSLNREQQDLFLRLLEFDVDAMEETRTLYQNELKEAKRLRAVKPLSEEERLMQQLRTNLTILERENAKARQQLQKLIEKLEKRKSGRSCNGEEKENEDEEEEKDDKKDGEREDAPLPPVYVMGIPITLSSKKARDSAVTGPPSPRMKINASNNASGLFGSGFSSIFQKVWNKIEGGGGGQRGASSSKLTAIPQPPKGRGSSVPNKVQ